MRFGLALLVFVTVHTPLPAAIITVSFQGAISSSVNPSIPTGTTFSGEFSYDSSTSPNFSGLDFSSYALPAGNLSVTVLGTVFTTNPMTIVNVVENFSGNIGSTFSITPPVDFFGITGGVGQPVGPLAGVDIQSMLVIFATNSPAVLSGTGLPAAFPALGRFSGAELLLTPSQGSSIGGPVDTGTAVPEASSWTLLLAGLTGIVLYRSGSVRGVPGPNATIG